MAFDVAEIKVEPEKLAAIKKQLAGGEKMMELYLRPQEGEDMGDPQLYRGWILFTEDGIVFGHPG